jgi:hypothetical protein
MPCYAPINIPDPKFKSKAIRIEVPCGKCAGCLQSRREDWTNRIMYEMDISTSAHFITLTYSDENITFGKTFPTLVKSDLQNFLKRLRKRIEPNKIRYYAVGEYGTRTLRPHYHIIMFNLPHNMVEEVELSWKNGFAKIGTVTRASVHYVTKYHINKNIYPEGSEPSFVLMSRKPGIGYNYIDKYRAYHDGQINRCYILQPGGIKSRLPRYYKDRLYTEPEREHIAEIAREESSRWLSDEVMNDHYRINPDKNYFEYRQEQILDKIRKYKIKTNQTEKL